jgi:hypothetical protein
MFRLYKNGDITDIKVAEYIADTEADVLELPTDVGSGSTCLVLQSSENSAAVYALGNDKKWHKL